MAEDEEEAVVLKPFLMPLYCWLEGGKGVSVGWMEGGELVELGVGRGEERVADAWWTREFGELGEMRASAFWGRWLMKRG